MARPRERVPGGTLTRPQHGNCSAIAGTWGNGPVHHLPGKRRAVRPRGRGFAPRLRDALIDVPDFVHYPVS